MADRAPVPQPPIFNLNAYSPAEIKEAVENVGVKKANLPLRASFMLAIVAGGSVGLGALYYTIVASDAGLNFATIRVVGGLAFSLGLVLVVVGGAELFTGNNLIVMAWASGKVSTREMLRNWVIVYLVTWSVRSDLLSWSFSHHLDMNGGRIGLSILNTAVAKIQPDVVTLSSRAFCVTCSSAWRFGLHMPAGRSPTKFSLHIAGLRLYSGRLRHCVANMYFLPLAWLLTQTGHVPTDFDASSITLSGIIHNLVPVTLGNIVGGAGLVGVMYWASIGRRSARHIWARSKLLVPRCSIYFTAALSAAGRSRTRQTQPENRS